MDILERDDLAFPRSLPEFQKLFPDDAACATYSERPMDLPLYHLSRVFHIGTLNAADLGKNSGSSSHEGHCLSVSAGSGPGFYT